MIVRRALLAGLLASAAAMPATAEVRGGVDVAANVGFSNNPFAVTGDDTSSGFGEVDIVPTVQLVQPRSTVTLSGEADVQQYFRRYSRSENYRTSLDYRGTPSERLKTHARVDYTNAIIGSYGAFDTASLIDPAVDATLPVSDIALFGTRDRRRNLRLSADVSDALSARDAISASGFGDFARYSRFGGIGDYDGYGGSLGYDRQLSQTLRAGLQGSVSVYDYDSRGTTRVYAVEATLKLALNEVWSVNGSAGVSFVDSDTAGSTRSTSLSGDIDVCRQGPLSTFCLDLSRQVRPTGFNGTQYVTAVAADWSRHLSERDTLTFSAAYSRENGAQSLLLPGLQTRYVRGSVGYDRRLTERLRLSGSVQYRDVSGNGFDRAADYGGRVGLAYRLGDLQ